MCPDMTPEVITYNGTTIGKCSETLDLSYESKDDIEFAEISSPINTEIKFNYKEIKTECPCPICRNRVEKVGVKKAIKWNSRKASYYKKYARRLKSQGIKPIFSISGEPQNFTAHYIDYYNYHISENQKIREIRRLCRNKYKDLNN